MAYVNEYGSGINLTALVTPVLQSAVFSAQESSLYMGGNLVPVIQVPENSASAQVPLMGSVTATSITAAGGETDPGADISSTLPANTTVTIPLDLIAARTIVRDLGNIDFNDIGRILGQSCAAAYDKAVTTTFGGLTSQTSAGAAGTLTVAEIFTAIGTIRGNGETGDLFGIVGTNTYAALMASIGGAAFAGGEFQNSAMRNGYFGHVGGVPLYVSSYLNDTDMGTVGKDPAAAIMSRDAVKSVQQSGGLRVEFERRAAAVGFDIVASIAGGVSMVDHTRGVFIEQ